MTSELFTIFGSSQNAATSGTVSGAAVASGFLSLASEIWTDLSGLASWKSGYAPQSVWIPKGTALKIWESKVTIHGGIGGVVIELSNDSGTTYRAVGSDMLSTESGSTQVSIRRTGRPLVFPSPDGYSIVRFVYQTEAATGGVFAEYNAEIVELETN